MLTGSISGDLNQKTKQKNNKTDQYIYNVKTRFYANW